MLFYPEQEISKELSGSERLIWSGVPRKGILLRGSDAFVIPFSILWCGFAIFWESMVVIQGAPFFFMLWGIPFVVIGLYFVFGRFIVEAKQREKTFYGLTSQRIIIISGLFSRKVQSLNLKTLNEITFREKSDGSGSIAFGASNPLFAMFGGMSWPGSSQYLPPSFEMIPNAKDVYEMVRKAQHEA